MGYESRLYIVSKGLIQHKATGLYWAEKIAEFNLCCVDNFVLKDIEKYGKDTTCYFDSDDDFEPIIKDLYNDPITEISLNDMIGILKNAVNNSDYRRYQPCLAMLESFARGVLYGQWGDGLVVLHYGY